MTDLFLVFTNAVEGRDDEFNAWYDSTHLADVLDVPGVLSATRYEAEGADSAHRYLTVYEIDRPGEEILAEWGARARSGRMAVSDTLDTASVAMSVWKARA